jgi:pyruvate/2-oxoglutarate dehydrogenase complex dihydrolipoamide dehydrogenase (E3) component
MEEFNVLVIGAGSGMMVAASAVANGLRTGLVESGPIGGTCINRGCVPSKMLVYPAEFATMIREAEKLGEILGGHIIGPFASILIQEIINAMTSGDGSFVPILRGLHIHPSMTEVVQKAFSNLKRP